MAPIFGMLKSVLGLLPGGIVGGIGGFFTGVFVLKHEWAVTLFPCQDGPELLACFSSRQQMWWHVWVASDESTWVAATSAAGAALGAIVTAIVVAIFAASYRPPINPTPDLV